MGVKLGGTFKKILEKAGSYNEEKHKVVVEKLNEITEDLDDSEVEVISKSLLTVREAVEHPEVKNTLEEKIKNKLKPEILDGVDAILRPYEALLDDKTKADYNKADSTYKKTKVLTEFLANRVNADGKDAASYQKKLTELMEQIDNGDYVTKTQFEAINSKVSSALQGKTYAQLFAYSMPKMSESKLKDKFVQDDFESRVGKMLKQKGWVIDYETGEVRKQGSPDEAVFVAGTAEKMTLEHLPDEFYKTFDDWQKKNEGGGADDIDIEQQNPSKGANKNLSRAASV